MGRTKLTLLALAIGIAVAAGCSAPPQEPPKTTAPVKLPPGMSFGYKPTK
jgi:hypothetical protein